jgi:GAF domain-containing protein
MQWPLIYRIEATSPRETEVSDMGDDELEQIAADLRRATGASRTTIRLEDAGGDFPVVAEDRGAGVSSLLTGSVGDVRAAATFQWVAREHRPLIQDDLRHADPAPPATLIEAYGAQAQMLAPVLDGDRLLGVVSVHESSGPRAWTAEEVAAIEDAASRVARHVAGG